MTFYRCSMSEDWPRATKIDAQFALHRCITPSTTTKLFAEIALLAAIYAAAFNVHLRRNFFVSPHFKPRNTKSGLDSSLRGAAVRPPNSRAISLPPLTRFRQSPPIRNYFRPILSTLYPPLGPHPRTARLILVLKMSLHIQLAPAPPAPHLPLPPVPRIFPLPAHLLFIGGKNSPVWSNKVIGPPIKTLRSPSVLPVPSASICVHLRLKHFRPSLEVSHA